MVRDPACGVYIPEQGALVEHRDGRTYHFCSEACREIFKKGKVVAE
jgi:YHS domain-containing protein